MARTKNLRRPPIRSTSKKSSDFGPRSISPGIGTGPARPLTYQSPLHLERQKFLKPETVTQLYFTETGQRPDPATIQTFGLDLEVGQARALAAVQILLHDTGFKGHVVGESRPILRITNSQYYEAYGLEKIDSGGKERYPGRQMEEALADLRSLTESRRVIYERKRWEGRGPQRKEVSDIVLSTGSLLNVSLGYEGLSQEEAEAIKAGRDIMPSADARIVITCGLPLVDQIDRLYVVKWRDLFKEIAALYPGRRQPRGVSLLVEYLWTLNYTPLEMKAENLAETVGLGYLIHQRKKAQALEKLQEYVQQAQELGYILSWKVNSYGNYVLDLNPEKCSRLKSALNRQKRLQALTAGKSKTE